MKVTEHARDRVTERLGVHGDSVDRMAAKALESGLTHAETSGPLNRYITALYFKHRAANGVRIYAEKAWLFNGSTLITVVPLDFRLRKIAAKCMARRPD